MLKDQREIDHYKESLIESIKQTKKDDIFTTPKKQTIWNRIIRSLGL